MRAGVPNRGGPDAPLPATQTLPVTWRNENYGRFDAACSAFRLYHTAELGDDAVAQIHGAASKAGYFWEAGRCAWIAWADSARERFIAGLASLGYAVEHAGSWSGPDADAQSPSGPRSEAQ